MPALALLVCALFLASPVVARAAEPTFTFTGRGWGHGIGMSQYGAKGYAEHGWKYPSILARYYQGTTIGTVASRSVVRVAIQKDNLAKPSWRLRGNTAALYVANRAGKSMPLAVDAAYTFTVGTGGTVLVRDAASRVVTSVLAPAAVWENGPGQVEVLDASGPFDRPNVCYQGSVRLVVSGSSLYLYDYVYMEDYVRCVAPRETPASWHAEALKAQCVAARSYAWTSLRTTGYYDVYCTTRSQVYNGWGVASGGVVTRHGSDYLYDAPVAATANQVVKYGSTVVKTYFHSTSGGHTENVENVWSGAVAKPYYVGVDDVYEYSAGSKYHVWPDKTMAYTAGQLRSKLLAKSSSGASYFTTAQVPASIAEVRVVARGVSGRVIRILLAGAAGDDRYVETSKVSSFKSALGLRDTWFYVTGFRWDGAEVYVVPGQAASAGFTVTPATTGALSGFVLRRSDGTTALASGSVSAGKGSVTVGSADAGVRLSSAALLPGTDLRGRQGFFYGPELPVRVITKVRRIAGADRYATSVAISKHSFPATAPAVVVVSGVAPADALSASGLAGAAGGPVLVTAGSSLPASVLAEIGRLKPSQAFVVGGAGVVDAAVEAQLRGVPSIGAAGVERLGGADRYDTASRVAGRVKSLLGTGYDRRAIVVSGESLSDGATAGGFACSARVPVLLCTRAGVPTATAGALSALGATRALVVGGSGVVPDATLAALPGGVRIAAGTTRYDTAVRLGEYLVANEGFTWGSAFIANTTALSDVLASGPLVGRSRAPLLLVTGTAVPPETDDCLRAHAAAIATCWVVGGSAAVSDSCAAAVDGALR